MTASDSPHLQAIYGRVEDEYRDRVAAAVADFNSAAGTISAWRTCLIRMTSATVLKTYIAVRGSDATPRRF
jgi:hypothetical protein